MTKPGNNPESGATDADVSRLRAELKRLRRPGLTDLAFRPQRYPVLQAAMSRHGIPASKDTLARVDHNLSCFKAAVERLPTEPLRRAASILFHVGLPGAVPALEARRRAADRAYTGRSFARQPDTIQRHLERDLLDPLLAEALQCLRQPASTAGPAWVGGAHDGHEAAEEGLDRVVTGLERRDLSGAAAALGAWLVRLEAHGVLESASRDSELDRMNRRALLRRLGLAGTLAALPSAPHDTDHTFPDWLTARHTHKIDGSALVDLEEINAHLWRVFTVSKSKRTALALVRVQVDALVEALDARPAEAARRTLCGLLGDALQLAGEVFFDSERYVDAPHCYTVAASVSKEARAFDLWSCALTRHAFIGVYERRFADAVPMLESAARIARKGDTHLSTRHWVDAVAAQAYAGMRLPDACESAIGSATAVQAMRGRIHTGGWLRFDGSRLEEERGACYVELGQPDKAEAALLSALGPSLSDRRRGSVLAGLSMVGAHKRDAEQVAAYGWQALRIARETGSGVVGRRLQALQPRLTTMLTDIRVHQLNSEISALRSTGGST